MGCEILISESKPGRSTQFFDIGNGIPGFASAPPACFVIGEPRQCIADGVEIGADGKPEVFKIIARVDDDGQVFWW